MSFEGKRTGGRARAAALARFRYKPGQTGNPRGGAAIPKDKRELYRESRRLALDASPAAMRRAIELIDSKDERVATINIQTVLDRAGIRPIDKPDEFEDNAPLDLSRLTPKERAQLVAALRLLRKARGEVPSETQKSRF